MLARLSPSSSRHPGPVPGSTGPRGVASSRAVLLATEWTPDRVRGDGYGRQTDRTHCRTRSCASHPCRSVGIRPAVRFPTPPRHPGLVPGSTQPQENGVESSLFPPPQSGPRNKSGVTAMMRKPIEPHYPGHMRSPCPQGARGQAVTEGERHRRRCLPPPPSCLRHATSPWRGRTYSKPPNVDPAATPRRAAPRRAASAISPPAIIR